MSINNSISENEYNIDIPKVSAGVFEWIKGNIYVSDNLPKHFSDGFVSGKNIRSALDYKYIHKDDYDACDEFLRNVEKNIPQVELVCRIKNDDKYIWYKVFVLNTFDDNGELEHMLGAVVDINAEMNMCDELRYRADYDLLTNARNVHKFNYDAQEILKNDIDNNYAILRVDIDKFKIINDLYGTDEGDKVLKHISNTINSICDETTIFARVSGDIFVILAKYEKEEDIISLINKINVLFVEYDIETKMKLSFGICKVDDRDIPINLLCDRASLAAKKIKGNLLFNYEFYNEELREEILREKNIEDEMNTAIKEKQFQLYLQPKFDIETSTVIGSEALVRWIHPEKGVISPALFIDLFENNGFIIKLDEYMWEESCKVLRSWIDQGYNPLPISINVSRVHIRNPKMYDVLMGLVKKYDLSPSLIELEITESAFLDDMGGLLEMLKKLQSAGFLLAMDDFGAGYSSLNMLKNVPLDIIKIDREFLNETVATDRGKTVIKYTIAMAKQLNMKVVAEGVETIDQAAFLLDAGCGIAQGFYYSRPIDTDAFERFVFKEEMEKNIEPEIENVLSKNKDIVAMMMTLDNLGEPGEEMNEVTITKEELGELKQAFLSVISKYRKIIKNLNATSFELDFKYNTVFTTLSYNSEFKGANFSTYEEIYNYTIEHTNKKYIDGLEKLFNIDYLIEHCKDDIKELSHEFEMEIDGKNMWMNLNVIPLVKEKQIDKIILVYRNITTDKSREKALEESLEEIKQVLDMTAEKFFIWDLETDVFKISGVTETEYCKAGDKRTTLTEYINYAQIMDDEMREDGLLEKMRKVLNGEADISEISCVHTKDGRKICFEKIKTLCNSEGKLYKIIGIIK